MPRLNINSFPVKQDKYHSINDGLFPGGEGASIHNAETYEGWIKTDIVTMVKRGGMTSDQSVKVGIWRPLPTRTYIFSDEPV